MWKVFFFKKSMFKWILREGVAWMWERRGILKEAQMVLFTRVQNSISDRMTQASCIREQLLHAHTVSWDRVRHCLGPSEILKFTGKEHCKQAMAIWQGPVGGTSIGIMVCQAQGPGPTHWTVLAPLK